ncbi:MAG: hypothetical protein KKA73_01765 [Chloroflexi bacterium]|nr:hypothetical protein [Chloroflexota bacterium]MBU1746392.1 hypothetical protein [Chloroflexota bacterium]
MGGTHVNDIAFAPDGAAWAAAADGHVARFDPSDQHQTVYTLKDETPYSPSADVVTVAPDGTVWVGTDQGVQRFDGSTWTRYHIGERLIRGAGDIAVASDGLVWVATALDGIWTFDPRMDVWNTQAIDLDELGVDGFSAIEVIPDGSLWFFGGTDIYQLIVPEKAGGQTEWVVHAHKTASKIGEVYYLATDALAFDDQILWIAGMSNQGPSIVRYDPTTQASITYNHYTTGGAMAGGQISSLTTAPDGSVWIGLYENGALHFIPDTHDVARGTWTHYTSDRDGLIRGEITSIAVGPDGAVWFGTDRGTVARCEVHE